MDRINCLLLLLWFTFASVFGLNENTIYSIVCLFEVWLHAKAVIRAIFNLVFSVRTIHVWRIGCVCGWRRLRCIHRSYGNEGVLNGNDIASIWVCMHKKCVHLYTISIPCSKCNVILQAKMIFLRCTFFLRSSVNWMDACTIALLKEREKQKHKIDILIK